MWSRRESRWLLCFHSLAELNARCRQFGRFRTGRDAEGCAVRVDIAALCGARIMVGSCASRLVTRPIIVLLWTAAIVFGLLFGFIIGIGLIGP
jgi:hypothetical protein